MKCAPFCADSREQDAVVGDDAHRHALDVREAADQRGAVARLELVELGAVDDARDDLAHVVGLARVGRDHAVQLAWRRTSAAAARAAAPAASLPRLSVATACARQRQRMHVVLRQVVGHARQARVHVAAAQVLGADDLADRRLHQRRAAQEDRALVLDDDGLVAHRRHVGAAGRARAHHHGDLRRCPARSGWPGCRRCGRSGRGRGTPRPGSAGWRRPNRPGRCRAGGSAARSPAPAGASSPSSGSRCRPSPWRRCRRSCNRRR